MTQPADRYLPSSEVVARRLGEELILVHLGSNRIFELNATSARLWELLVEGQDVAGIQSALKAEFHVDEATLIDEVATTLAALAAEGLIAAA